MAYQEIESNFGPSFPKKDVEEGQTCAGTLKEKIPGEFNKNNYMLSDAAIDGEKVEGGELTLWGSSVLCGKMDQVELGQKVRVTYLGEQPPKVRGQNPTKLFKVEVDK